jgi:hypothetical protein
VDLQKAKLEAVKQNENCLVDFTVAAKIFQEAVANGGLFRLSYCFYSFPDQSVSCGFYARQIRLIHIQHFFAHGQAFRGFAVFQVPDRHFQEIGNCNSLGALVQALPALDALGGITLFSPVKNSVAADGVHDFSLFIKIFKNKR